MNRLNFEEDNHEIMDDVQDAEVDNGGTLWDFFGMLSLNRVKRNLDEEELVHAWRVVGMALKLIAKKAKAYELMFEKGRK